MGLDVYAHSRLQLLDPHPRTDTCWNEHLPTSEGLDFPRQADGLVLGRCYIPTDETKETYVGGMSYGGYNRWREQVCTAVLGMSPEELWREPEGWTDLPLADLIHFTDCDGIVGPSVARRLAEQMRNSRATYAAVAERTEQRGHLADYALTFYDNLCAGFELAADEGMVTFA